MVKRYCDVCGKEIDAGDNIYYLTTSCKYGPYGGTPDLTGTTTILCKFELCHDCLQKVQVGK